MNRSVNLRNASRGERRLLAFRLAIRIRYPAIGKRWSCLWQTGVGLRLCQSLDTDADGLFENG